MRDLPLETKLVPMNAAAQILRPLGAVMPDALAQARRRKTGEERPIPLPWAGYAEALCGGMWPGMHVLVSSTGSGKSAFAFQIALSAAREGFPVAYVGLELDEPQIALRVLGEHAGVRWSSLYLGRADEEALAKADAGALELASLPFYVETGPPGGWPASRMVELAQAMRAKHPTGPMLLVVDFLQLVGPEESESADVRERIGRAAYIARDVARRYGAAVLLVSSAARDKYDLLTSSVEKAGLVSRKVPGFYEPIRTMLGPAVLVGLGKESGEIEFAADSVTVLVRWPVPLDNGETPYICAVPKVRYGPARWSALRFWYRFEELPASSLDDLPAIEKRPRKSAIEAPSDDELDERIVAAVRLDSKLRSKSAIALAVGGNRNQVWPRIGALFDSTTLVWIDGTARIRLDQEENGKPQ